MERTASTRNLDTLCIGKITSQPFLLKAYDVAAGGEL